MKYKYWKIWHKFCTWHNNNVQYIYFWIFCIANYFFLTKYLKLSDQIAGELTYYGMVIWFGGYFSGVYQGWIDEYKSINEIRMKHYDEINKMTDEIYILKWGKK